MTTRYRATWPHLRYDRRPLPDCDAVAFPRVVRQEWTFDAAYPHPVLCQLRYSPTDRVAAWFVWEPVAGAA